jgi:ParB-like nuclease domain
LDDDKDSAVDPEGPDDGEMAQLPVEQLLKSSLVDPRRHLELDRVQRYSKLLDELPPVTVFRLEDQTLLLADGYHRLAAAQQAGRSTVKAEIREGTRADAMQFATKVAARERGISDEWLGRPSGVAAAGGGQANTDAEHGAQPHSRTLLTLDLGSLGLPGFLPGPP